MEVGEKVIKALGEDPADDQQPHFADHFVGRLFQHATDLGHLPVDFPGQGEDLLADFSQGKTWPATGNQLAAQLFLQALERLTHCRLRQVQAGGSAADALLLANHPKGAQQVPVQAVVEQALHRRSAESRGGQ
ncbi:hypothetical protein D3C71_1485530 [compost metagenome]